MEKKSLIIRLFALVAALACAPGMLAAEAYACYTSSNTTLTFYYDNQRTSRTGTTYDLNTGTNNAGWVNDSAYASVTKVVFDPSFADARPTTTSAWFYGMQILRSIEGLENLNTSEVSNMAYMFYDCNELTSLDLSSFNTANVTGMSHMFDRCVYLTSIDLSGFNTARVEAMDYMFNACISLQTIYAGNGWSTVAVTESENMFNDCIDLVGGQGTSYDRNHLDKEYAHIDGGPSNPGYFTAAFMRGDVNMNGLVDIDDVTDLINYVLNIDDSNINISAADCHIDGSVDIDDVTALINYVLNGNWD